MDITEVIEKIRVSIYKFDTNELPQQINSLIELLSPLLKDFTVNEMKYLQEILEYINIGMQNKDYLLVSDILKFELNPFLKRNLN
jgi:hypothetical protein